MLRRRVSPLGQKALRAAWTEVDSAARLVFSSRHGEFGRTLSIMDALVREEEVSPADFTLSVHHALAGLLSIAQGNHLGHTAIAAGTESLFFGLMEAVACSIENPSVPVVLVYYDEPLPEPFDHFRAQEEETIALALRFEGREGAGLALRMSSSPAPAGAAATPRPGNEFLAFLQGDASRASIVGDRMAWSFEKTHAAA